MLCLHVFPWIKGDFNKLLDLLTFELTTLQYRWEPAGVFDLKQVKFIIGFFPEFFVDVKERSTLIIG